MGSNMGNSTEYDLNWLISVDDHVLEPPNVWQDRVPAKYKDIAPRMVTLDSGGEAWVYEDKVLPTSGLSAVAGKKKQEFSPEPVTYSEMRPGCYDAAERVKDMNIAGILASLNFPSFPRFCGQIFMEAKDRELGLLCLKAYNDWMIDEWCATDPGRFIPLIIIPLWDPKLAAAEMERCAAKGVHAFAFSENTAPLGLPTIHDKSGHWDPVMQVANDAEMVVCMHVGSSSTLPMITVDSPFMANLAWGASRTSGAMLSWLFSGYFTRFPKLKIALSEGEIGWIPYFLERAEQVIDKQRYWVERGVLFNAGRENHAALELDFDALNIRKLYHDHVYGCLIDDIHGLNNLDVIGEDNVMCETDYPHSDSTWPDSIKLMQKRLAHLAPEVQYKVLRGNAERLYQFTPVVPSTPPGV
ncbi:MAG: amidohydrolase family protein [Acidimicrobiia bacterium]